MHSPTLLPREPLRFCCEIKTAIVLRGENVAPLRPLKSVKITAMSVCVGQVHAPARRGEWFYGEIQRTRRTGVSTSPLTSCWVCCLVYPFHAETLCQLIGFMQQHFSNYPNLIPAYVCNNVKVKKTLLPLFKREKGRNQEHVCLPPKIFLKIKI
jgi:hypothetical protein